MMKVLHLEIRGMFIYKNILLWKFYNEINVNRLFKQQLEEDHIAFWGLKLMKRNSNTRRTHLDSSLGTVNNTSIQSF